jgi:aspartate/methionine/tyrosine aminotransferase
MEVMERALSLPEGGPELAALGVGEPDVGPAPAIIAAAGRALQRGDTRYTDSRGLHELRTAIAQDATKRRGVEVTPDRVLVTQGTSPGLVLVFTLLLNPGDEVIVFEPHYPCYPNIVRLCGGEPVLVSTFAEEGYVIDVARVKKAMTPKTRAIIVASPANPTGAVQPKMVIQALLELGLPIVSDEIYDELLFDGAEVSSPLSLSDDCFVLDGFSKRYAMTGFRLGYVIAPPSAMRLLQSMQQNAFISAGHFAQTAAICALADDAPVRDFVRSLAERRELLCAGLEALGFGLDARPDGAFYAFTDARRFCESSVDFAGRLLTETRITVAPGLDFGPLGEGFIRWSFAASRRHIELALERLGTLLR